MKVLLFSGTEEGRSLAQWLADNKVDVLVKVATEYGAALNNSNVNVSVGSCGGVDGISELIVNGDLQNGDTIHINKVEGKDELSFTH